jgi:acyl-homoserine lactone acylase PvdQ
MEKVRRAARGKLSAVFGESQLNHDKLMRSMRLEAASNDTLETLSTEVRESLQAYA